MPASPRGPLQFVRFAFGAPLLLALLCAVVAWQRVQLPVSGVVALAVLLVGGWALITLLHRCGVPVQIFLTLALVNVFVVLPEMGLRALAFRHLSGIEFGYPRPEVFLEYVKDPELFWKFDASKPGINSWGFRGAEVAVPRPPATRRILFLGDSCTFAGNPPYSERAEALLNASAEGGVEAVECVNLSTAGYTAHQGQAVAGLHGDQVDPEVVVVYYGWNDHWLAWGSIDAEKEITPLSISIERVTRRSRLLQAIGYLAGKLSGAGAEPLDEVRVPPDQYRTKLTEIAEQFEARGVAVVFVTAPTSHRVLGVDPTLIDLKFARDTETVLRIHTEYTDIVRAVAAARPTRHLLDLEREFGAFSKEQAAAVFIDDGIHFEDAGMDRMAERVVRFLREECGWQ